MGCIVTRSTPKGNSDYGSDQSFENNSLAEDIHKNRKETEFVPQVYETNQDRMPPRAIADFSWLTSNYITVNGTYE